MMENTGLRNPKAARGSSLIELAIILPVLMLLVLGVVDFARAIQFNNILVAMSREGANLASRTTATPQNIITALNNTAAPLVMSSNGMIYITQIIGTKAISTCVSNCTIYAKVQAQTREITGTNSNNGLPSQVWNNCITWSAGKCVTFPSGVANNTASLAMTLSDGETVYAVETRYNYTVIVNYVMKTGPKLYSLTVL